MGTNDNIRRLRLLLGLSQEELARMTGYNDRSSIAKIEAGQVDLSETKIASFAAALGVTPAELMGMGADNVIPLPTLRRVPLLGAIACGKPILAEENYDGMVDVPDFVQADFALRCRGDSMMGSRIMDGDIVYIRQQPSVESGEVAAVLIDDEATLKRVRIYPDHIVLSPDNPNYRPFVYWDDEMKDVRILGKATYFVSAVR